MLALFSLFFAQNVLSCRLKKITKFTEWLTRNQSKKSLICDHIKRRPAPGSITDCGPRCPISLAAWGQEGRKGGLIGNHGPWSIWNKDDSIFSLYSQSVLWIRPCFCVLRLCIMNRGEWRLLIEDQVLRFAKYHNCFFGIHRYMFKAFKKSIVVAFLAALSSSRSVVVRRSVRRSVGRKGLWKSDL